MVDTAMKTSGRPATGGQRNRRFLSGSGLRRRVGVAALTGLATVLLGSATANAAVPTPFVSTSTSESGGGTVGNGTVLNVTFNQTPVLAGSYSLMLTDGSTVDTLSSAAGTLSASVNGTSIAFTVHVGTSLSLSVLEVLGSTGVSNASGNPWDLIASGQVDKSYVLAAPDQVTVNYNAPVTVWSPYSLTLSEGSSSAVIDNTDTTVSGSGTATLTFTLTGAPHGSVAADGPVVTASTGITAATVTSDSVSAAPSTTCADIGFTRVFGGSNCSIGFGHAGPSAPDVFDVIPLPTTDLPGPPDDNAPEVITNCEAGSTDTVYDVNTGAELGANPCGNNPPEQNIGNTNSATLDYISTPNLASFEEAGVVESIPGITYVSATSVPPQIAGIQVSGSQATFTYFSPVVCQNAAATRPTHLVAVQLHHALHQPDAGRPRLRERDLVPLEQRLDVGHGHLPGAADPVQLGRAVQVRGVRPRALHRRRAGKPVRQRARGLPERVRGSDRDDQHLYAPVDDDAHERGRPRRHLVRHDGRARVQPERGVVPGRRGRALAARLAVELLRHRPRSAFPQTRATRRTSPTR